MRKSICTNVNFIALKKENFHCRSSNSKWTLGRKVCETFFKHPLCGLDGKFSFFFFSIFLPLSAENPSKIMQNEFNFQIFSWFWWREKFLLESKNLKNLLKFSNIIKFQESFFFLFHALGFEISEKMNRCEGERINQHFGKVCVSTDTCPQINYFLPKGKGFTSFHLTLNSQARKLSRRDLISNKVFSSFFPFLSELLKLFVEFFLIGRWFLINAFLKFHLKKFTKTWRKKKSPIDNVYL